MCKAKSQGLSLRSTYFVRTLFFVLCAMYCSKAFADDFREFENAKNAYEAGDYEASVERFEILLTGELSNKALIQETHKLLAVSYLFVGNKEKADVHFTELLVLDPDFDLDPLAYPIDVIDFFTEVKNRYSEQLRALASAKAEEDAAREKAEEEKRKAEFEKLKRNVYVSRDREERSKLLALMPLGVGQFQNGHKVKGAVFLGSELLLAASATTTYILHESLRPRSERPFESTEDRSRYERLEVGYRVANQASLVTLGVVAILGIIDSVYYFESETTTWDELDEKDVPDHLRHKNASATLAPIVSDTVIGIGAWGTF